MCDERNLWPERVRSNHRFRMIANFSDNIYFSNWIISTGLDIANPIFN
jgi:hypothetical protein